MTDLRNKFLGLADALKASFLERDREVEGLVVALLARQHVLLLGPPGTAKSQLSNALCGAIGGAERFQWLLTRYSTPEEIFGPVALSALKQDRFKRVTTGKLPEAHVVFLDETFKANSAILNALLTAINERRYHNNGGAADIPLEILVGASNELPEGGPTGELAPYYDRFLLRFWVEPLRAAGSFVDLLSDDTALPPPPVDAVTLDELRAAQAEVARVTIPRATAERLFALRQALAADGIAASDRRWVQACAALRANAWLSGDPEVTEDHFTILASCMWDDPEQRRPVAQQVQQFVGQEVADALKVHDAILDLITKAPADPDQAAVSQLTREGKRAEERLEQLASEARTDANKAEILKLKARLSEALTPVRARARKLLGL